MSLEINQLPRNFKWTSSSSSVCPNKPPRPPRCDIVNVSKVNFLGNCGLVYGSVFVVNLRYEAHSSVWPEFTRNLQLTDLSYPRAQKDAPAAGICSQKKKKKLKQVFAAKNLHMIRVWQLLAYSADNQRVSCTAAEFIFFFTGFIHHVPSMLYSTDSI